MNGVVDQIFWLQVVRKRQVVEGLQMTDEVLEDRIGFVERGSRSDRRRELLLVEVTSSVSGIFGKHLRS